MSENFTVRLPDDPDFAVVIIFGSVFFHPPLLFSIICGVAIMDGTPLSHVVVLDDDGCTMWKIVVMPLNPMVF